MAKKAKKSTPKSDSNVVRIKAGAPAGKAKREEAQEAVVTKVTSTTPSEPKPPKVKATKIKKPSVHRSKATRPLTAIGGYFKGAWVELRQVHWPTRRATWSLTFAVLMYSTFFIVVILLLDAGFKYLFEIILGK